MEISPESALPPVMMNWFMVLSLAERCRVVAVSFFSAVRCFVDLVWSRAQDGDREALAATQ